MKPIIDISKYQPPDSINYGLLCDSVSGVIIRCSYGSMTESPYGKEPYFATHYREITKRGIPVGTYLYLTQYQSIESQVRTLVEKMKIGAPYEIRPEFVVPGITYTAANLASGFPLGAWLDVEYEDGAPKLLKSQVDGFMTQAEALLGYEIGIYTGGWTWNPVMGSSTKWSGRKLWMAAYTASPTNYIPNGWKSWWLWQYTSSGRLSGYENNLDMNKFFGTVDQYVEWVSGEKPVPVEAYLDVPSLSQQNSLWKSDKLGTSGVTIGSYGCLITATAAVCNYYGKDTNPRKINQDLIRVGGYVSTNLLQYASVTDIYGDIVVDWSNFINKPIDAQIDAVLLSERPVIVQVDYKPATIELDQHWVVIVGKSEDGYIIMDPIDGGQVVLQDRYGDKIYKMVVFSKQKEETSLYEVIVTTDKLNIRSGPGMQYDPPVSATTLNTKHKVYEEFKVESTTWLRIGLQRWISGDYTKKVGVIEPTLIERVVALENWVKAHG